MIIGITRISGSKVMPIQPQKPRPQIAVAIAAIEGDHHAVQAPEVAEQQHEQTSTVRTTKMPISNACLMIQPTWTGSPET